DHAGTTTSAAILDSVVNYFELVILEKKLQQLEALWKRVQAETSTTTHLGELPPSPVGQVSSLAAPVLGLAVQRKQAVLLDDIRDKLETVRTFSSKQFP
ncbi:unnamed protein product, partial [Amoebophrya sp. A120]